MTIKRASIVAATVVVVVVLAVGLVGLAGSSGSGGGPIKVSIAAVRSELAGSPAPLAGLHAQASDILGGGLGALRGRLRALRGRAVVINKWASWCEPCRAEFGVFQRVSVAMGRRVAFIGIDSSDTRSAAAAFLRAYPLSYPSYFDPNGTIGYALTDSGFTPVTAFYAPDGKLSFIRQGPYPTTEKLERDVERYGLGA